MDRAVKRGERGMEWAVVAWIKLAERDPQMMRNVLGQLARLLRENRLPKSGREFLAAHLDRIANGGDPAELLPRKHKRKSYRPEDVLAAVEREMFKRGQDTADRLIYDQVCRKFGIARATCEKEASIGRANIRGMAKFMLAHDSDEEGVTAFWSAALGLPPDRVQGLLFTTLFVK